MFPRVWRHVILHDWFLYEFEDEHLSESEIMLWIESEVNNSREILNKYMII